MIVNEKYKEDFRYIEKQKGAMLAKGRLLGLQFDTLFTDGLYFEISAHAVKMADQIRACFDELGVKKLPTSKMLQIEYSTILEQKKKDYAKMQQLRRNLNQIALVQRRVDLLRELAAQQQEQQRPDRSAQR